MFDTLKNLWNIITLSPTGVVEPGSPLKHQHGSRTPRLKVPKSRRKAKNQAQRQARRINRR